MKLINFEHIITFLKRITIFFLFAIVCFPAKADVHNIKFETSLKAVMSGENGLIMFTVDGGYTWSLKNSGLTNVLYGIDILPRYRLNGNEVSVYFITAENGVVLRSTDNCNTWDFSITCTLNNLNDICIVSGNRIFAAGDNGTMVFTNNLGNSWSTIYTGNNENINDLAINTNIFSFDSKTLAAAGNNGTILLSYDLGNTWIMAKSITPYDLSSITFADKQFIFAAGKNGTVLRSSDNGINWQSMNTGTNMDLYKICYLSDGTKHDIICSSYGAFIISHDMGNTWYTISAPINIHLLAMDFGSSQIGIAAGIENQINYTTDGGLTWQVTRVRETDKPAAERYNLNLNNYPNPFNPETNISFNLNQISFVSLKVYNSAGKEIKEIVNEQLQQGAYSYKFIANNLPSGVYFYKLYLSNGKNTVNETRKMILVK